MPTEDKYKELKTSQPKKRPTKEKYAREFSTVVPIALQDDIKADFDKLIEEVPP